MRKGTFLLNHSTLKGVMDLAEGGVLEEGSFKLAQMLIRSTNVE